ncbi:glycosyl hydrolase family 61-domain-containing protein [Microdochium trichocladiopsis]|uniref:lytic cellulose monooxygenase (C4-dehydrogenating) n=1 Tax=Microdochium trichocladiopsis TaxID=1682393 RepID=A0A9P9BM69_9PEZI|nr:glycosyl hydrolase family 61-domain-containing protein [Microdochium trichocladiopsis]KAH7025165.1 glycosyl hydrolase family 61-domain-containing protein [Microdochium trichocladiopsis]
MKYSTAAIVAALVPSAYGHYFWNRLIVNGVETGDNEFVRKTTRPTAYNPIKWKNVRDNSTPDLDDIRCNQGAFSSAASTKTKEVAPGDNVGFKLAVGATMQHPGPALAYLSKAPSTASTYRGDGEWVKIWETGVCDTSKDFTKDAWCTWDKDRVSFDLPKDLPNGEYLLRIEHIGLHGAHDGQSEFYPSCAQIKVVGGTDGGSLGSGIKLPGGYKQTDPSFNFSLWNGYKPYPMPGGPMYAGVQGGEGSGNDTAPAPTAAPTVSAPATTAAPTTLQTATQEPGNTAPTSTPAPPPSAQVPGTGAPAPAPAPAPVPNCPNAPRRKSKRSRKAKKAKKAQLN